MNIVEKLKQFDVTVTPEMEKAFAGDFLSEMEVEKKLTKAQNERDTWKERAENAEATLKGFEGKDFETITKERDEWKKKAEDSERAYAEKEAEREKQELLKEAFSEIEFTSESAKKAIVSAISDGVTVKNGKLIGFNDLLEDAKKNDASAFVDKNQKDLEQNRARFTAPDKNQKSNAGIMSKDEIMAIKDRGARREAMMANKDLFGL